VLASGVLTVLAVVVLVCLIGRAPPAELPMPGPVQLAPPEVTPLGVCTAAGLVFFAFAGYARTATLGPAVRDPDRTLRRAIPLTVLLALLTYLAVGAALLHSLGSARLISEASPLAAAVGMIAAPLGVLVRLGAAAATVSMLLIVLPVVSRTTLAMARRGDLPAWFARVGSRGTSCAGDLVGTLAAALIAALAGPVASVALSACCVLVYYAVVNLAALRLPTRARHWPGWTALLGLLLCLGLAALLPHRQVVVAATVLLLGWLLTTVSSRRSCPGGAAPAEGRSR
jgi:APA family basic amino acid/polyamine antiporter